LFGELNTLIIPVLTGLSSAYVSSTELNLTSSNYSGKVLVVPPFNMDESNKFVRNVVRHSNSSIDFENEYKENPFHKGLLHWFGGVPRILSFYGEYLSKVRPKLATLNEVLECANEIERNTIRQYFLSQNMVRRIWWKRSCCGIIETVIFRRRSQLGNQNRRFYNQTITKHRLYLSNSNRLQQILVILQNFFFSLLDVSS
jgi:hypothetical protein